MSGCERLRAAVTQILDAELGDDVVALRQMLLDALTDSDDGVPVVVSGPDVRSPVYLLWPGDLKPVQYQPVPTQTSSSGTPTGVERRQA